MAVEVVAVSVLVVVVVVVSVMVVVDTVVDDRVVDVAVTVVVVAVTVVVVVVEVSVVEVSVVVVVLATQRRLKLPVPLASKPFGHRSKHAPLNRYLECLQTAHSSPNAKSPVSHWWQWSLLHLHPAAHSLSHSQPVVSHNASSTTRAGLL